MGDPEKMNEREVKQAINAFFAANPIDSARYRTPEKQAEIRQLHVRLEDIRQTEEQAAVDRINDKRAAAKGA